MQKLMITTAIVAMTSFGALAQDMPNGSAPDQDPTVAPETTPDAAPEPGVAPDATAAPAADPAGEERTADRLMGATVYDAEGDNIANVDDVLFDADHAISHLVMDVGGFLGLGSHTVALGLDDVDITWSDEDDNVRVQVSMSQDQLEELPEYEG